MKVELLIFLKSGHSRDLRSFEKEIYSNPYKSYYFLFVLDTSLGLFNLVIGKS